jgi:hypothetical protein
VFSTQSDLLPASAMKAARGWRQHVLQPQLFAPSHSLL